MQGTPYLILYSKTRCIHVQQIRHWDRCLQPLAGHVECLCIRSMSFQSSKRIILAGHAREKMQRSARQLEHVDCVSACAHGSC